VSEAFLCDGVRTPFGRYGGSLAQVRPDDLAALTLRALMDRNPALGGAAIDEVVLGCANQAGEDNRNVARMAALLGGLPVSVPGATVNRLCASGLEAVAYAAARIASGQADLMIAGGVESMTRAPFVMGKAATAFSRASGIEDTTIGWRFINPAMRAAYGVDSMPETGENVACEHGIDRASQDAFALRSQQRAAQARAFLAGEIIPVSVPQVRRDAVVVQADEHPRADTSLEGLAALRPIVRPGGTVTAGNAAGVNDGAAVSIVASADAIRRYGLTPRARISGYATAGVEPRVMGIGPVPAIQRLCDRAGLSVGDFDLIELNEAFASQALAVLRAIGVADDADHVNPKGGAIALGHPLGASGGRLCLTAARQIAEGGRKRALIAMCVGVGQGAAMALEAV